jgi:Zn-dependent oligopeptidase
MLLFLLQDLAPWDTPYYTHKVKREWLQVGSSEFSPYFSLGTCMEGLNNLMNSLYNISLISDELAPGEVWASDVYKLAGIIRTSSFFYEILDWSNMNTYLIYKILFPSFIHH